MLRRIKIKNFKSFRDLDVSLPNLAVIFGPNAAGKSNLLDALQLLSGIATSRTLKEAFDSPYRGKPIESFSFPDTGIRGLIEQGSANFSIEADIELSDTVVSAVNQQIVEMRKTKLDFQPEETRAKTFTGVKEKYLRYRVKVEILPKSGILRIVDEYLAALKPNGAVNKKRKPFLERVENRLHLRMEGQAHSTYYERLLDHSILSLPLYPPHFPHVVAMRQELASWRFFYFEPREHMRATGPVKEARHIGLMGEDLAAFLNTLRAVDERQFRAVEKTLHMIIPQIEKIEVEVNELGEVELRLVEGDMPVSARVVSEGTLRILGLIALSGARESPAIIGFEEPENGVHPRRIKMITDLLKNRALEGKTQLIITTHSPILPDLVSDDNLLVCRKTPNGSIIEPFQSWGELARAKDIEKALNVEMTFSERMMRGDFDV